jgi:hypothetical protein
MQSSKHSTLHLRHGLRLRHGPRCIEPSRDFQRSHLSEQFVLFEALTNHHNIATLCAELGSTSLCAHDTTECNHAYRSRELIERADLSHCVLIVGAERCASRSADVHRAQQTTKTNLQIDRGVIAFWFKLIIAPRDFYCGRNRECI